MKRFRIPILLAIISILLFSVVYGIDDTILGNVSRPIFTLTVTKSGAGTGTVTSDVYNINCGVLCSQQVPMGTTVTLTATPDAGNLFNGWSGDGVGVTTRVVLINGNKTVNADFQNAPSAFGDLVAWYKVNEGSGTTIINSANPTTTPAQKWPNLTVTGNVANFWGGSPGFGLSAPGANEAYCTFSDAGSALTTTTNDTFGMFFRRLGSDQQFPFIWGAANATGALASPSTYTTYATVGCCLGNVLAGDGANTLNLSPPNNQWKFIFNVNTVGIGKFKGFMVNSDGTLTSFTGNGNSTLTQNVKKIQLFMFWDAANGVNAFIHGNMGDLLYYRNVGITQTQWKFNYNLLRSRYGMSAPSGW